MADLGSARGEIRIDFDGSGVDAASRALSGFDAQSGNVGAGLTKVGGSLLGLGAAIAAPFVYGVKVAADFEQQLSGIAAVGGADAVAAMDDIREAALQMGADTSFSATEAAGGMEELVKAGIPIKDVLAGAAEGALDLAAATGTSVPQAAEIMGVALNVFGEGMVGFNTAGEQAVHVADLFAASAANTSADVDGLAQALGQSALIANQFGIGIEETIGTLSAFADEGLKGSDAGTSFKTMLISMLDPTDKQAQAMSDLGLSFFDAQGEFVGLDGVAGQLQTSLSGLTDEQRSTALAVLFGTDAVRAADILYGQGAEGIREYTDLVNQQGAAEEQARLRLDNLKGALEGLLGPLQSVAIAMGSTFIPALRAMAEGLTVLLKGFLLLPSGVQTAIAVVGALTGVFLIAAGGALLFAGRVMESVQALKALRAAMALRGISFAGLAAPVLAFAAAAGLAYVAYKKNFLGIQDLVKDTGDAFSQTYKQMHGDLKGSFGDEWGAASSAIAATGAALQEFTGLPVAETFMRWGQSVEDATNAFDKLTTPVSEGGAGWTKLAAGVSVAGGVIEAVTGLPVADNFNRWGLSIQDFSTSIDQTRAAFALMESSGVNPVTKGIQALLLGFEDMPAALKGPLEATSDLARYLERVGETGNVANAALDQVPESLRPAAIAMGNMADATFDLVKAFKEDGLQGALAALPAEAAQFGSALLDLAKIAANVAVDVVVNIGQWVLGQAADFAGFLQDVVTGQGSGEGAKLHDVLVNVVTWAVDGAKDLWAKVEAFATGLITGNNAGTPTSAEAYGLVPIQAVGVEVRGWIVSSAANLWDAVKRFVTGDAGNAGDGFGTPGSDSPSTANSVSLGSVLVDIAGYVAGAIDSVWGWLQDFVTGGGGGMAGDGFGTPGSMSASTANTVGLGDVAVDVAKWLDNGIASVWTWLTDTAIPNMGDALVTLAAVAVDVGTWTVGVIDSVWVWLQSQVTGNAGDGFGTPGSDSPSTAGVNLGTVTANVAGWIVGQIENVWAWLQGMVSGGGGGMAGDGFGTPGSDSASTANQVSLGTVKVAVTDWVADIDWDGLWAAVTAELGRDVSFDADTELAAHKLGIEVGEKLGEALQKGLRSYIAEGPGSGGANAEPTFMHDLVIAFVLGILQGGSQAADDIQALMVAWTFLNVTGPIIRGFNEGLESLPGGLADGLKIDEDQLDATMLQAQGILDSFMGVAGEATGKSSGGKYAEGYNAAFGAGASTVNTGETMTDIGNKIGADAAAALAVATNAGFVGGEVIQIDTDPTIAAVSSSFDSAAISMAALGIEFGKTAGSGMGAAFATNVGAEFSSVPTEPLPAPPFTVDGTALVMSGMDAGLTTGTDAGAAMGQGFSLTLPPAVVTGLAGLDLSQDTQIRGVLGVQGVNISNMTNDEIVKALQQHGFQGIPGAMTERIVPAVSQGFDGVVTALPTVGGGAAGVGPAIATTVSNGITTTDFSAVGLALRNKLAQSLALTDDVATSMASMGAASTGGGDAGIASGVLSTLTAGIAAADFSPVGVAITAKIGEALAIDQAPEPSSTGGGAGIAASVLETLLADIEAADFSAVGAAITAKIASAFSGGGEQTGPGGEGLGGGPLTGLLASIQADLLTIGTAITTAATAWGTTLTTFATTARTAGTAAGTALQSGIAVPLGLVTTLFSVATSAWGVTLTTFATTARTQGTAAGTGYQSGIAAPLGLVTTLFSTATSAWSATLTTFTGTARTQGTAAGTGYQSAIASPLGLVTTLFGTATAAWLAKLTTFATDAKTAGTNAGNGFKDGIKGGLDAAATAASTAVSTITTTLNGAAEGARLAGLAVGNGFALGMEASLGRIEIAAGKMVAAAATATAAAAQMTSPSKLFAKFGGFVGEGFALGIESELSRVATAAARMVSAAADATLPGAFDRQSTTPVFAAGARASGGGSSSTVNHGSTYTVNIDGATVASGGDASRVGDLVRQLVAASGVAVDVAHAGSTR